MFGFRNRHIPDFDSLNERMRGLEIFMENQLTSAQSDPKLKKSVQDEINKIKKTLQGDF